MHLDEGPSGLRLHRIGDKSSFITTDLHRLQSAENNKVHPTVHGAIKYHERSRLHGILNTEWKCYNASDYACPELRTLNTLSPNPPRS